MVIVWVGLERGHPEPHRPGAAGAALDGDALHEQRLVDPAAASGWGAEHPDPVADVKHVIAHHDVNLVLTVCDHVYVLDFGAVIAEGPPDAIRNDRAVAEAYLGTMHDTEAVTA